MTQMGFGLSAALTAGMALFSSEPTISALDRPQMAVLFGGNEAEGPVTQTGKCCQVMEACRPLDSQKCTGKTSDACDGAKALVRRLAKIT
jgi:hypothetical protein